MDGNKVHPRKKFVESNKSGPRYPDAAKNGDLSMGLSHREKSGNMSDTIQQSGAETTQRMPKGHDRV